MQKKICNALILVWREVAHRQEDTKHEKRAGMQIDLRSTGYTYETCVQFIEVI